MGEVELDLTNFAASDGVYNDFKESINAAIKDIYQEEDMEWPFAWVNTTFTTTIGQNEYNKHANALAVDWDSFRILKTQLSIYTITQTAGIATATVLAGHQLITGDFVCIGGATETDYVGNFTVTVTSPTQFTFPVASTASSPATGTPYVYMPYPLQKLTQIDYDAYREERFEREDAEMLHTGQYTVPRRVVRKTDNNIILSGKPDRIYTISYNYFQIENDLVNYNDAPNIPEAFKQTIVDGGIYYAYMFRDNLEEAAETKDKFTKGVNRMRRILIPQQYYMRIVD